MWSSLGLPFVIAVESKATLQLFANLRMQNVTCARRQEHLVRVCLSRQETNPTTKPQRSKRTSTGVVHQLQEDDSSSSAEEHLHTIFQSGNTTRKFIVSVCINGVKLEMEVDSGAEWTTVPWLVFQENLVQACDFIPTSVTLHRYDQSPLTVKGQYHATVQVNEHVFESTFIVVDVSTQYPLFGRDWMSLLRFDISALMQEATQIHNTMKELT